MATTFFAFWRAAFTDNCTVPSADATGTFRAVAAAERHACGLRTTGRIVCWGDNENGELDAPAGSDFVAISGVHWPAEWSGLGELWESYRITKQDGSGNFRVPLLFIAMLLPLVFHGSGRLGAGTAGAYDLVPRAEVHHLVSPGNGCRRAVGRELVADVAPAECKRAGQIEHVLVLDLRVVSVVPVEAQARAEVPAQAGRWREVLGPFLGCR